MARDAFPSVALRTGARFCARVGPHGSDRHDTGLGAQVHIAAGHMLPSIQGATRGAETATPFTRLEGWLVEMAGRACAMTWQSTPAPYAKGVEGALQ